MKVGESFNQMNRGEIAGRLETRGKIPIPPIERIGNKSLLNNAAASHHLATIQVARDYRF